MQSVAGRRDLPGFRIGAAVVWLIGAVMTYNFFAQTSDLGTGWLLLLTIGVQIVLTLAQSPVWHGRGSLISYTAIAVDALINFGGVMYFVANIDQAGSTQALMSVFGVSGGWPMPLKAVLAAFLSAVVAGLPEYLWRLN